MELVGGLLLFCLAMVLYFLPAILADKRGHSRLVPIFILNFFLGWTLVGWVIALMWVYMEEKSRPNRF
jgi:hypothetical protein